MKWSQAAILLAAVVSVAAVGAHAQERPAQVRTWPLEQTVEIGRRIWRQDMSAARATDALLKRFNNEAPSGLVGWIVVDEAQQQRVRFLSGAPEAPKAAYDVIVDEQGRAGDVTDAEDIELPSEQLAQFFARQTAGRNIGALRCSARYNAVVLDDPDSDQWLVWLLASTTDANKVPTGGHYRFRISADGQSVSSREQLSAGCLDLDRRQAGQGDQAVGLMTNVVVADQPLEIHVFLSLLNRLPFYVLTGETLWGVTGQQVRQIDLKQQRQR